MNDAENKQRAHRSVFWAVESNVEYTGLLTPDILAYIICPVFLSQFRFFCTYRAIGIAECSGQAMGLSFSVFNRVHHEAGTCYVKRFKGACVGLYMVGSYRTKVADDNPPHPPTCEPLSTNIRTL